MSDGATSEAGPGLGGNHTWWQAVVLDAAGHPQRLTVVDSPRHPDGSRVPMRSEDLALLDDLVVCEAVLHAGAVTGLHVSESFAPGAPSVWFAEVEPEEEAGASDLLAFTGSERAPGALVGGADVEGLTARSADQVGAVRWFPRTGEVDQVYVQPAWRRRHLGSLLVAATACLNVARDQPRLWADGERTELGELLRNARSWRDRTADLEHLAPPMTPAGLSTAAEES